MIWIAPSKKDTAAAALEKRRRDSVGRTLALQRKIQNFRRTLDLLLPRLLSGQINLRTN